MRINHQWFWKDSKNITLSEKSKKLTCLVQILKVWKRRAEVWIQSDMLLKCFVTQSSNVLFWSWNYYNLLFWLWSYNYLLFWLWSYNYLLFWLWSYNLLFWLWKYWNGVVWLDKNIQWSQILTKKQYINTHDIVILWGKKLYEMAYSYVTKFKLQRNNLNADFIATVFLLA